MRLIVCSETSYFFEIVESPTFRGIYIFLISLTSSFVSLCFKRPFLLASLELSEKVPRKR